MTTYDIYAGNMDRLRKKLTTIQNKCRAYGCDFRYAEVGEVYKDVKDKETGEKVLTRFVQVEADGVARVDDWEFVATIEHDEPMNIVRCFIKDAEIPHRYFTAAPICEHCHTRRARRDTYLIRNVKTGEYKQVGKSCLRDFTGGLSAEMVARYISAFDELIAGQAPSGGPVDAFYPVEDVLAAAAEAVRLYGYVKADGEGTSTKCVVIEQLLHCGDWMARVRAGFDEQRPDARQTAQAIIAWVPLLEDDYGYRTNLKAACSKDCCQLRDFGLIASAIAAYRREMDWLARKTAAQRLREASKWIGEPGDRIELHDVKVRLLTSWENDFGSTVYLWELTDDAGNICKWRSSSWISNRDDGDMCAHVAAVKGTVKDHTIYHGCEQTELTRCRITYDN